MSYPPNRFHRNGTPTGILPESQEFFVRGSGWKKSAAGFSFPDLLVALGVLSLLLLLQISAFAHNKGNSRRAVCADNQRLLALSWLMYADDNRGRLAPNRSDGVPTTNDWVAGWLDYSGTDATNLSKITQAKLYPYNKAVEIYHCPDDVSSVRGQLRIRSYSMNSWIGDGASGWLFNSPGVIQVIANRSQVRQPDQTFVFIEEHPDSINDGMLYVDMVGTGPATRIIDYPAAYHYLGANLSFADGSVGYRQWVDPRTTPPPRYNNSLSLNVSSPRNLDVAWLQSVTTYLH